MNRILKIFLCLAAATVLLTGQEALAKGKVATHVRVIIAATGKPHVDPSLRNLGDELKSVFRYNSYRLLKERYMDLGFGETGRMHLPGNRTLEIIPNEIKSGRIRFNIKMNKAGKRTFGTDIRLKNGSSITIGGPRLQKGYLLLNISGKIR